LPAHGSLKRHHPSWTCIRAWLAGPDSVAATDRSIDSLRVHYRRQLASHCALHGANGNST
jgi:hypothetical protein